MVPYKYFKSVKHSKRSLRRAYWLAYNLYDYVQNPSTEKLFVLIRKWALGGY